MEDLINQSFGKYKILQLLGQGGMGTVFRAYDTKLDREVAIKVMHPQFARQPDFQRRFLLEARAAARLNHPGIVQIYDSGEEQGYLYIVMELIVGENLRKFQENLRVQGRTLPLAQAILLIRKISQAVDHAHRNGVLHRDLKPDNIMLKRASTDQDEWQPVITDLGLAKLSEGTMHTLPHQIMGTLAYMSPEQLLAEKTDARSDIYSLGVLLYELAVGQRPFPINSLTEALRYHTREQPPKPRAVRPDLPVALERIILRALAKEPAKRYQTAGELAEQLAVVPLSTAPPTKIYIQPQQGLPKKNWWVPALLLLLLATVIGQAFIWLPAILNPVDDTPTNPDMAIAQTPTRSAPVATVASASTSTLAVTNTLVSAPTAAPTRTPISVNQQATATQAAFLAAQTQQAANGRATQTADAVVAAQTTQAEMYATQTAQALQMAAALSAMATRQAEEQLAQTRANELAPIYARETAVANDAGHTLPLPVIDSINIPLTFAPGQPFEMEVWARNGGATGGGGGGLTVSLPQGGDVEIVASDLRMLPATWSDCNYSQPNAWLHTSSSPCRQALRYGTLCPASVLTTQVPMAEIWDKPWQAGTQHFLRLRITPPVDSSHYTIHVRVAVRAQPRDCSLVTEPLAGATVALDQQGFPAYVFTLTASR